MRKTVGYILLTLGICIAIVVWYSHSTTRTMSRPFSSYSLLASSWNNYKKQFINEDGRVIDHGRDGGITTSEGQSYAMLRAVWVDDKQAFDSTWNWTKTTLKIPDKNLFGWNWGKKPDGSYGFIDSNTASDADSDIAFALILASRRWSDKKYLDEARKILTDMWKEETEVAGGKRYLTAGNWANSEEEIIVNPSYFAPYAWRVFAKVDTKNDWNSLVDPAYQLLVESGQDRLDKEKGVGLPPDWVSVDKSTGRLSVPTKEGLKTDYSYDAIRVPWRIAVDYIWNKDEKARTYLINSFKVLEDEFTQTEKLSDGYSHDGKALSSNESPSMYATFLGYLMVKDPQLAKQVYEQKVIRLYSTDQNTFNKNIPYYEQNWLWFAAALYNKRIVLF